MTPRLIVWGAGGHGKVVVELGRAAGRYATVVVVDDAPEKRDTTVAGARVIGTPAEVQVAPGDEIVLAIGDNRMRAAAYARCKVQGLAVATVIHPTAVVSPTAVIGEGTVVAPLAVINADARVGRNCIINTGAIVEHDCIISDHVHASPRVAIGGAARVGAFSHVGLGAVVLPGVHVGANTTIGAGAVAIADVPDDVTAVGVPARIAITRTRIAVADAR